MKAPISRVVIILTVAGLLAACTKINLSGNKGGNQPAQNAPGGSLLGGGQPQGNPAAGNPSQQPTLDGQWEIDYEFRQQPYVGNVEFAQQNGQVAGQGTDQNGLEYEFDGTVDGDKVTLTKKYVNADPPRPPVTYTGQLKYLQDKDYTGWLLEGTYNCVSPKGEQISGKWLGYPSGPPTGGGDQATAPAGTAPPPPGGPPSTTPPPSNSSDYQIGHKPPIGNKKPGNISGNYSVAYQYRFKKTNSKMWLRQDGDKLSGDGQDTTTGEKFVIKGWYVFPKVTIIRMYRKVAGGKENRDMTFKGVMSSDGSRIVINGETEFGGQWDGELVRY